MHRKVSAKNHILFQLSFFVVQKILSGGCTSTSTGALVIAKRRTVTSVVSSQFSPSQLCSVRMTHENATLDIDVLFNDFRLFSLFKEFMESKHASEVVTGYMWLLKLQRMSPKGRRKKSTAFVDTFIGDEAPRQLNLDYALTEKITSRTLTDEQIDEILEALRLSITDNWVELASSPLLKRFQQGEYEPRISQSEAKRFRFIRKERRDSDELIIQHFKQQSV